MKKYCFDIDGTICTTDCHYDDARPYKSVIKKINSLYIEGHHIIITTSRGYKSGIDWKDYTIKQLEKWDVKYHELIMGKPQYDLMVDDIAVNNLAWYDEHNIDINE